MKQTPRSVTRTFSLVTLCAVGLALWSPPATALETPENALTAVEAAAAASQVALGSEGDAAGFAGAVDSAGGLVARNSVGSVVVPVEAGRPVVVDGAGTAIAMSLPVASSAQEAVSVAGNAVFVDETVSTVVDVQSEGVRVMEVLKLTDAPSEYTYDLDLPAGSELIASPDGGAVVATVTQDGEQVTADVVATFAPPWAVDAVGTPVPVTYKVVDNTLTMIVDQTGQYQYPLVADPSLTLGDFRISWSILSPTTVTILANKRGTQAWLIGTGGVCTAVIALTALIPLVGPAVSAIIAVRCAGELTLYGLGSLYNKCAARKATVTLGVAGVVFGVPYVYSGAFCK